MFLPRKNYQAIANRDRLILDDVGETDIVARNDFPRSDCVQSE
jgi:hypothetical protein